MTFMPPKRRRITKSETTTETTIAKIDGVLADIQANEVSLVNKAANKRTFLVVKADEPAPEPAEAPAVPAEEHPLVTSLKAALATDEAERAAAMYAAAAEVLKSVGFQAVSEDDVVLAKRAIAEERAARIGSFQKALAPLIDALIVEVEPARVEKAAPLPEPFEAAFSKYRAELDARLTRVVETVVQKYLTKPNPMPNISASSGKLPVEGGVAPKPKAEAVVSWPRDLAAEKD